MTFGQPIDPESSGSDAAMYALAALLPERQRGEYTAVAQGEEKFQNASAPMPAGDHELAKLDGPLE